MIVLDLILDQDITNCLKKLQAVNVMYMLSTKIDTLNENARKYAEHIYRSVNFLKRRKS